MIRRLLLGAAALGLALLVAEGTLSLLAGRSLREVLPAALLPLSARPVAGTPAPAPAPSRPPERAPAAGTPGPAGAWRVHEDPHVSYALRSGEGLAIDGATVRSDDLGLRARPAGREPADCQRIVVLGGSVAFGSGVNDDETLAARLEAQLLAARGPDARPVACRTVALPGWNHRAQQDFLRDHLDELRPDILLLVPEPDDLFDMDGVSETGTRRLQPDCSQPDPWLTASALTQADPIAGPDGTGPDRAAAPREPAGPTAITADLSPESSRRYDEDADSIVALRDLMRARGGRMMLLWEAPGTFTWHVCQRLAERAPDLPSLGFLSRLPAEMTLGSGLHLDAAALDGWANRVARELLERGWVSRGAGLALPPQPARLEALRFDMPPPSEWRAPSDAAHAEARQALQPGVDLRSGRGRQQVLGGCNRDGTARARVLLLLAPGGDALALQLAALPGRPDLYPMTVAVRVDGADAGSATVAPGEPVETVLPLPPRADPSAPMEVLLIAPRWGVVTAGDRTAEPQIASFQPLRVASVAR